MLGYRGGLRRDGCRVQNFILNSFFAKIFPLDTIYLCKSLVIVVNKRLVRDRCKVLHSDVPRIKDLLS